MREYIWLPEAEIAPTAEGRTRVDRPLAVVNAVNTASPATYYVHVDHLNRPVLMTDGAKANVWAAVWQAWGGVHSITGAQTLDARFPGQWFQAETGLHYNWHRHYDPTIGRYTQPDPLGFVDGPSVYGYVGGKPQSRVDSDGRNAVALPCLLNPYCAAALAIATLVVTQCKPAPPRNDCLENARYLEREKARFLSGQSTIFPSALNMSIREHNQRCPWNPVTPLAANDNNR